MPEPEMGKTQALGSSGFSLSVPLCHFKEFAPSQGFSEPS